MAELLFPIVLPESLESASNRVRNERRKRRDDPAAIVSSPRRTEQAEFAARLANPSTLASEKTI
jgi:hypothetical protein